MTMITTGNVQCQWIYSYNIRKTTGRGCRDMMQTGRERWINEKETGEWSQTLCWTFLIRESTFHRFVLFKILVLMPPAATNRAALII